MKQSIRALGRQTASPAPGLSRRALLKGALAVAPYVYLAGCGGGGSGAPASGYDTVVVGSGMSGLAAASTLAANGLRVLVLEGRNRIGGRTYTYTTTFDVPVDLGGQWLHQATANPLAGYAIEHGYTVMLQDYQPYVCTQPDMCTQPATLEQAEPAFTMFETVEGKIDDAGEAAAGGAPDRSVAQATVSQVGQRWYQWSEAQIGPNEYGTNVSDLSCQDLYNFNSAAPVLNLMIKGGMGTFVSSFAMGLNIQLSTAVTAINWGGLGGVQAVTARGVIPARTVIVTTPMGGLAGGVISFNPALPGAYLEAIANLPMGVFEKIFVGFSKQVFDTPVNLVELPLIDSVNPPPPLLQAPVWGGKVGACIVGGDLAGQLVAEGSAAMIKYAQQQLAGVFGNGILSYFQNGLATSWEHDPWTLGSYTHATPGHAAARQQLAMPLGQQVFFAGGALSVEHFSTVHGAYLSGITAANQVLSSFVRQPGSQAA